MVRILAAEEFFFGRRRALVAIQGFAHAAHFTNLAAAAKLRLFGLRGHGSLPVSALKEGASYQNGKRKSTLCNAPVVPSKFFS